MATILSNDSKKIQDNLSEHEQIIKTQLEQWIADVYKNTDLDQRLKKSFENKSNVSSLSQM